jgi:hypothetical protein
MRKFLTFEKTSVENHFLEISIMSPLQNILLWGAAAPLLMLNGVIAYKHDSITTTPEEWAGELYCQSCTYALCPTIKVYPERYNDSVPYETNITLTCWTRGMENTTNLSPDYDGYDSESIFKSLTAY